eukprot:14513783-Alexandrium_andersonii.AAC.1
MLCPCPQTLPRYEDVSLSIAPYLFPFDPRVEAYFDEVGVCVTESMRELRKDRPAIPALNETVEFISASDTGTEVMRALKPGSMLVLYVDNLTSPAIALALDRGTVRALADAEPDAVA